jgi:hypothetical protein
MIANHLYIKGIRLDQYDATQCPPSGFGTIKFMRSNGGYE